MSTIGGPDITTDGIVLALDASNTKSYPGSGTTWFDLSGNSNHATLYNSPVFSTNYVTWDGTNQYAEVTYNSVFAAWSIEQTVSIWLRHSFTSGRKNPWNQAYGGYGTWTHENGANINAYYGNAGSNALPYTAVNSGTTSTNIWNHMTVTRDTSYIRWYKNGIQTNVASNIYGELTSDTNNILIGRGYAGYWVGDMGIITAYNRALTADEILQNYNATKWRFGS